MLFTEPKIVPVELVLAPMVRDTPSRAAAKATRGEVIEATPTSFSYSWGQLNGENKKDKELAFEQSLGSLLTPFYKNALVNRQVKTNTYYRQDVYKRQYIYIHKLKDSNEILIRKFD